MTELYRYVTPSFLSGAPAIDHLTNSLARDTNAAYKKPSGEASYSEEPTRPPLYPYSPF